jgi:hypothetical protein
LSTMLSMRLSLAVWEWISTPMSFAMPVGCWQIQLSHNHQCHNRYQHRDSIHMQMKETSVQR